MEWTVGMQIEGPPGTWVTDHDIQFAGNIRQWNDLEPLEIGNWRAIVYATEDGPECAQVSNTIVVT